MQKDKFTPPNPQIWGSLIVLTPKLVRSRNGGLRLIIVTNCMDIYSNQLALYDFTRNGLTTNLTIESLLKTDSPTTFRSLDISIKYFSLAFSKGFSPRFGNYWRCLFSW
jgi:hypothetical protein